MGRKSVYIEKPVINIGDVNHSRKGRTRHLHGRRRKPNILEEGGISFGYCSCNKCIRQKADAN